jgi:hypothetical protein
MFAKVFWKVVGLAAVVTLPAVGFTAYDLLWKKGGAGGEGPATTSGGTATVIPAPVAALLPGTEQNVEGPAVQDLAEVLRFDVTPEWILRRWPRVSTIQAQLELQGYRVPLVTGTGEGDLAGALTYYYNAQHQVQRITFKGTTGDPHNLLAFVAGRLQFVWRPTNDPGLTVYEGVRSNGKAAGSLQLRSARIVKASEPYTRFEVELTVERE